MNAMYRLSLLVAMVCCLAASPAAGKKALLARIDNPELHNETMTCNSHEMDVVSETITDVIDKRRRLDGDEMHGRFLVPKRCKGGCQAAPSYCQFMGIGCVVQNRRRLDNTHSFLRQLGEPKPPKIEEDEKKCLKTIEDIQGKLGKVAPTLSSPCQEMVKRQSKFSCVEVVPCSVSHFSLWNVDTNAVMVPVVPLKGTQFCQNVRFTVEATVNFDNGPLQFSITEKKKFSYNSTMIYEEPYFMTAGSPSNATLQGLTLVPGTYDLAAWPENDTTKQVVVEFKVKKC